MAGLRSAVRSKTKSWDQTWSGLPSWERPISNWDDVNAVGRRSRYVASVYPAPIMVAQGHGLIVNISSQRAARYSSALGVACGVAKAALASTWSR